MGTTASDSGLAGVLFGKARRNVLSLLFAHPDEAFYVREIVRAAGVGLGAVQRELAQLCQAGVVRRSVRGRQVYYQANPRCPVFSELRSLITKTSGMADVLRAALAPLADRIRLALIFGSVARGQENRSSDVDILVVGDVTFAEVVSALQDSQRDLGRELNPSVYPPPEFQAKMAAGHSFLKRITSGQTIFLIGDERDLAGLGAKRMAR